MAIITCSCTSVGGNTGYPNCESIFKTMAGFYLVPMKADDGTENKILLSDTINQTYWDAKVQNTDPSKRFYPIHDVKNPVTERAESVKFTYEDGTTVKLEDGARTTTLILNQRSFTLLAKLKQWECVNAGIYAYDVDGNILGEMNSAEDALLPIEIQDSTWDALFKFGTSAEPSQILLNFQAAKSVKDYMLKMIVPSEMDNIDVADSDGLYDANGVFTSPTSTGVVAALTTDYGTFKTPVDITGLVFGDFTVRNTTSGTTYAVSAAAESPTGTFTVVYATAPSGTYQLEIDATKGYEPIVAGTWAF